MSSARVLLFPILLGAASAQYACGDCDANGAVDLNDVRRAAMIGAGLITPTGHDLALCNVTGPELHVNVLDALLIVQTLLGAMPAGLPMLSCPQTDPYPALVLRDTSPELRHIAGDAAAFMGELLEDRDWTVEIHDGILGDAANPPLDLARYGLIVDLRFTTPLDPAEQPLLDDYLQRGTGIWFAAGALAPGGARAQSVGDALNRLGAGLDVEEVAPAEQAAHGQVQAGAPGLLGRAAGAIFPDSNCWWDLHLSPASPGGVYVTEMLPPLRSTAVAFPAQSLQVPGGDPTGAILFSGFANSCFDPLQRRPGCPPAAFLIDSILQFLMNIQ